AADRSTAQPAKPAKPRKTTPSQDKKMANQPSGIPQGKGDLFAIFQTSAGSITCRLFEKEAPETVANFVGLAMGSKEWTDPRSGTSRSSAPKRALEGSGRRASRGLRRHRRQAQRGQIDASQQARPTKGRDRLAQAADDPIADPGRRDPTAGADRLRRYSRAARRPRRAEREDGGSRAP